MTDHKHINVRLGEEGGLADFLRALSGGTGLKH